MARLFGTDGVRGVANKELTCETAFKLGQAAVAFQGKTILIGKDTRLSGDMLESAVASGIMSMGGTALLAGIIPTPAIALLVRELHCDGGIVISASHNPPEYNGIKLFDGQGFKLPDAVEDEIEAYLAAGGPSADELPNGNEIDGDVVEAVCAIDLHKRGLLAGGTAVSTVMCNLGLSHALRDAGIELVQTKVGDRYVLEAMREGGFILGGEQSGHMIFLEHNSTGDGLVTALQFLAACRRAGSSIEDVASVMTRFPQTLINVRVNDKHAVDGNAAVQAAVEAAEAELGDSGRVLLRPSGTEPVVRVMVEAASAEEADRHAQAIAAVVEREA